MQRNMTISLLAGYITVLLPVWSWDNRIELFIATIAISIAWLIVLIWMQETIKKVLVSANTRTSRRKLN